VLSEDASGIGSSEARRRFGLDRGAAVAHIHDRDEALRALRAPSIVPTRAQAPLVALCVGLSQSLGLRDEHRGCKACNESSVP